MITATALVLLMIPGVGYGFVLRELWGPMAYMWAQVFLLRSCASQVCSVADMAVHHGDWSDLPSVVLLGLFSGFLSYCWQVYW